MQLRTLVENNYSRQDEIIQIAGDLLGFSKEQITLHFNALKINKNQISKIKTSLNALQSGVPLPYLLKKYYFFNSALFINRAVLIPRFETEVLVLKTLQLLENISNATIIDIGTGSGNIIIALAKARGNKDQYFAVDISKSALKVAQKNAQCNKVDKIKFYQSDLMENKKLPRQFDVLVANLPYLNSDYLAALPEKLSKKLYFEPRLALDGGRDGMKTISRLLNDLPTRMHQNSIAIIEIDSRQKDQVITMCKANGLTPKTIKDLNNRVRFVEIRKATRQA